jgi:S1-C subfamily serine protease
MNRESQARFVAVLLFLLTVAAVIFAGLNFQKERESTAPDDGVWWIERGGRLFADRLEPDGPGAKSGIKPGDELISVNSQDVRNTPGLERQLYRAGVWSKATYSLARQGVTLDSSVSSFPRTAP